MMMVSLLFPERRRRRRRRSKPKLFEVENFIMGRERELFKKNKKREKEKRF